MKHLLKYIEAMPTLYQQIYFEEGERLSAYRDSKGKATIGVGHLIRPGEKLTHISEKQALQIFLDDVCEAKMQLAAHWPRYVEFDRARQDAFINMVFQLGINGFMGFERMRAAAMARDWPNAHKQALDSKWARQDTPHRAARVASQIKTGKHYDFTI